MDDRWSRAHLALERLCGGSVCSELLHAVIGEFFAHVVNDEAYIAASTTYYILIKLDYFF